LPGLLLENAGYSRAMATRKAPAGALILLVRHGATPTTGRILPGRAPGLHLSEDGERQAERVAERVAPLSPAALYTSPLERAVETAAPTAAATGLDPVEEPGLLECDFGDWTGEALSSVSRHTQWRSLMTAPASFRFPGGESLAELEARVVTTLERLRTIHAGQLVVCFSHADPIRAALTFALGAPLDSFHRVNVGTGSISVIRFPSDAAPSVLAVNSLHGPLDLGAAG
jgi:probable phosphoglycerate mutase